MDTKSTRDLADQWRIYVAAAYLRDPKGQPWDDKGIDQFRQLATNPGAGTVFVAPSKTNPGELATMAENLTANIGQEMERFSKTHTLRAPVTETTAPTENTVDFVEGGRNIFAAIVQQMLMSGCSEAFQGWAWDHDLAHPAAKTFDPCVLVTRSELNYLYETLNEHVSRLDKGDIDPDSFLKGTKLIAAWLLTKFSGSIPLEDAQRAESDISYLRGLLPYESYSLGLNAPNWETMGAEDRNRYLRGVKSKLQEYMDIREDDSRWLPMGDGKQDPQDYVALLPLNVLP
jgi:serine/threonine-protein kinase PpkA